MPTKITKKKMTLNEALAKARVLNHKYAGKIVFAGSFALALFGIDIRNNQFGDFDIETDIELHEEESEFDSSYDSDVKQKLMFDGIHIDVMPKSSAVIYRKGLYIARPEDIISHKVRYALKGSQKHIDDMQKISEKLKTRYDGYDS